jgi:hypothetical protein
MDFSWSDIANQQEQQLGRELTPDEFGQIQEDVLAQAIPVSLTFSTTDTGEPDIRSLVFQMAQEHPDWSPEQVKDAVRKQFLDVMMA